MKDTGKKSRKRGAPRPVEPAVASDSIWQDPFVHVVMIVMFGFLVYCNSIAVPFIYDDNTYLVQNPAVKSFACYPQTKTVFGYSINLDIKHNVVLRPLTYFTFALNYALHGLDLFGYHLVNLLLHIGCGLLAYRLVSQLMAASDPATHISESPRDIRRFMALFVGLLFVVHPLQTQAVTYIIQRFVPLATFFYLATLVLYLRARRQPSSPARAVSYALSLICAVLAMESKEIAFTLPLMVALVEWLFLSGPAVRRLALLVPFLLTMAIIPFKILSLPSLTLFSTPNVSNAMNLVNFTKISRWDYLMTQFGVIVRYLRLLVWPTGQNFDYDYPLRQHFFTPEVLLPLALLLGCAGLGIVALLRSRQAPLNRLVGFGIGWFFITLSVESSIIPIADLIFEHRAYLPSIGFFIAAVAGLARLEERYAERVPKAVLTMLLTLAVLAFAATAVTRNRVWQNEVRFMRDIVSKSPHKARGYLGLGEALMREIESRPVGPPLQGEQYQLTDGEKYKPAIEAFRKGIELEPKRAGNHIQLAEALIKARDFEGALSSVARAAELQPKGALPHLVRGRVYAESGDHIRAKEEYREAIRLVPAFHLSHIRLGELLSAEGDYRGAREEFRIAMQLFPDEYVRKQLDKLKDK